MKKRLVVSFSGGATSGLMLWWILNEWEDRHNWETIVVFANTGKEDPGTLVFVHRCSWKWNIPIVWVEAKHKDENGIPFSKKGWQVKHKVVDYFTASRKGEPFEEMISVLGIPSTNAPFCSDQLKRLPIESYLRSIGWEDYYKAIGMRADEPERINVFAEQYKIIYPLHNKEMKPMVKYQIGRWWEDRDFKLEVHSDDGNCDNCWKKNTKLLIRNARRKPLSFDWWQSMTDKYGHYVPRETHLKPPFNFYRGNRSPVDIFKLLQLKDQQLELLFDNEPISPCSESCEAF